MRIAYTSNLRPGNPLTDNDREWIYNSLDCCVTLEVLNVIEPQLDSISRSTYEFSKALQAPVLEMTARGVLIDEFRRQEVLKLYREQLNKIESNLDYIVNEGIGVPLNWRSNQQLNKLFYEVLQIPPVRKRNAKGQLVSTVNRDAIEQLQSYFYAEPVCIHLLALRDLGKKIQFLSREVDSDQRIRTNLNIAGTNTGRFASSISDYGTGDNLQNVDRDLRSVFIPDPGYKFCNLDLEQGDSRNLGAICWELFCETKGPDYAGSYLDACESGDLHTTVARLAFPNMPWTGDLTHDRKIADQIFYRNFSYRDQCKRLGHGTNFLGTPLTMSTKTKVPLADVKSFRINYFGGFPVIPDYHEWVRQQLWDTGVITTLFDRRRYFFGRPNDDKTLRDAVAYSPQSMTGEETNKGLLKVWRANRVILLLQVHDSILIQFPEETEDKIVPWLIETMRVYKTLYGGREFYVPVEAKVGWNWGDVKYDDKGNIKDNPDGMIKWKGSDNRWRTTRPHLYASKA